MNNKESIPLYIEILKYRMYSQKMTQRQIAKMLKISPSRLNDFIKGRGEPSLALARKMSECLDIRYEAFFKVIERKILD